MWPFNKKKNNESPGGAGQRLVLNLKGLHCSSCSLNIDGELEETDGVHSSSTNYASSRAEIEYDPSKVSEQKIKNIIESLGYSVV